MPELPEVETVARGMDAKLRGRVFESVLLARSDVVRGDPAPLCALLRDRRVVRAYRRGKRIVVEIDNGYRLIFHLGMSGQLTVAPASEAIEPHKHLRIGLANSDEELRYRAPRRFGGIWCVNGVNGPHIGRRLSPLGAEPLAISFEEFAALLKRPKQIKALLLDQQLLSGMGNIYCDEALFRAKIHPQRIAAKLRKDKAAALYEAMRDVLAEAIAARGSSIRDYRDADSEAGGFQRFHRVYNRTGKPCSVCGAPIVRLIAAGRSTHVCPRCQRRARPRSASAQLS